MEKQIEKVICTAFFLTIITSFFAQAQEPLNSHTIYWNPPAFTWDSARVDIEQYYGRKRSLLDNDTFPIRGRVISYSTDKVISKPDVLLVGYAVYSGYGVVQYSGSVIITTDALKRDVPQGGDTARLLNEVIEALVARGELRNVRLDRPAQGYVEILAITPIRSTGFVYSTRLAAWQQGQTPKK